MEIQCKVMLNTRKYDTTTGTIVIQNKIVGYDIANLVTVILKPG